MTSAETAGHRPTAPTALIVGASRGLGHALAAEFADRGWKVVGTVRDIETRTLLHELADRAPGRVSVEQLDVNEPAQLTRLRERLARTELDVLFVNAGTTRQADTPIGAVPAADFVEVMLTNALGPMRVVEALEDLVAPAGLIGAMSSGQGSITNNTTGLRELYRGSKAALNMFMRGFAARHSGGRRAFVLMAPGWIRTELGGPDAPFTLEENVPRIVDVLLAKAGRPGLEYLDYQGRTVPW
ncbi:SDR family NAD(P)-dependent oxidoreductase [Actinacidiphila acidipaludis]|uniref:SDR family oxidoreductase n=1 Tax=Actinacidiphila acidipaludis TaxID=2873382 RepID=A0ABS7Q0K3_9ACTN|nr:SDR family NAD(P)-dependent oxidoreductase [Streptomyces acidipaludis]MBY8876665.1 SDR family oxidoreductase [Streptomyces acidipaludis]